MLDRTERFSIEQPKKEVPLKTSHDKMDLVELPKFINFGCDMGLLGDPDNFEPMSPKPDVPPKQKASLSDEEKNKDMAKTLTVQLEWAAQEEKLDSKDEDASDITPIAPAEEAKPIEKDTSPLEEKTVKETEVKVAQRKPSVQEKPEEKRPESRGKKNWGVLRKSLSKVRCIMVYNGGQLFSFSLSKKLLMVYSQAADIRAHYPNSSSITNRIISSILFHLVTRKLLIKDKLWSTDKSVSKIACFNYYDPKNELICI